MCLVCSSVQTTSKTPILSGELLCCLNCALLFERLGFDIINGAHFAATIFQSPELTTSPSRHICGKPGHSKPGFVHLKMK